MQVKPVRNAIGESEGPVMTWNDWPGLSHIFYLTVVRAKDGRLVVGPVADGRPG
jgi:hypothetical protein